MEEEKDQEVREGFVVPGFRLRSSTGDEIGAEDYRNKAHLVLFLFENINECNVDNTLAS